jgi:pSer/pThr/pTyr-binding forkhead associated (FHA) protein
MIYLLIALDGLLRGSVFSSFKAPITIGRDTSNNIILDDLLVSRHHALIQCEGDRYDVVDQESRNGVFVDGIPITRRSLDHGDHIRVGTSTLLVLLQDTEDATSSNLVELNADSNSEPTLQRRPEDALHVQPDQVLASLPLSGHRMARDFNTLVRISTTIGSARRLDALQRQILDLAFDAMPAEQGVILLGGEHDVHGLGLKDEIGFV